MADQYPKRTVTINIEHLTIHRADPENQNAGYQLADLRGLGELADVGSVVLRLLLHRFDLEKGELAELGHARITIDLFDDVGGDA